MSAVILVALGGAAGSVARYLLSGVATSFLPDAPLPVGTLLVNVLGCLAVGVLGALVVKQDLFSVDTRLLLFSGVAGGFTTFSAFGLETFQLLRRGETLLAGGYVVASVALGVLAAEHVNLFRTLISKLT